jgi:GT2 family glycosyltransferase
MKCSALICTYNRPELLQESLQALIERTNEKPDQVVIVNGGDERTDRIVHTFTGRDSIEVQLVKIANKNLAASRNVGLPHCTGDIIAMTDDDAQVFPDWITRLKQAHQEHPEAGAVGGPVLGTNIDSLVGQVADAITFPTWSTPHYVRTLPGVNIAYKRAVVEQLGRQDESLFRGEDVDYNWRLQKLGYKVYFDPRIKVYHYHRPTLSGFLNQHYMYGRAYYLVRRKWQDLYCIYPHEFRRPKDFLKAANVLAMLLYQPILSSLKLPSLRSRLAAIPLLFLVGAAWEGGMLVQAYQQRSPANTTTDG